jgi:PAS domain S-box-containing protein
MQRILIVDDNDENLYYLQALLRSTGYEVITAGNGAEALDAAIANPPELIISDLLMPIMDGFSLLRQWKSDQRLNRIPFVVYTATYTDPKDEQLALDLGADAFIVKPTEPAPFMARIREVMAKAVRGDMSPANSPVGEETDLLRQYSEVLIHKLESKALELEEANRTLSVREAHLGAIIENSPNCITSIDSDGTILSMNEAGQRMMEADSAEEIAGKCVYQVVVPEFRDALRDLTERVCRGETGTIECEIEGLKGSRRWLEMSAAPLRDSAASRTVLLGIAQDTTHRKHAERVLQTTLHRFYAILSNLYSGVLLVTDEEKVEFVNLAFCNLFCPGDKPEGMVGLCATDMIEKIKQVNLHPDTYVDRIQEIVNEGKLVLGEEVSLRTGKLLLRDFVPLTLDGKSYGRLWVHTDITELKRAEAARAADREKLDVALASMTDAVFISDANGQFTHINAAFASFHKFKSKEECARKLSDYMEILEISTADGKLVPHDMWSVPRALRGETGTNVEYFLRRKDTGASWVASFSFSPLRDNYGAVIGSVVVGRDITQQRQLEEQYRQAQKMETVGQLTGGIAHDFNNLLTVILGCSEFIGEEVQENPRLSKMANMILDAARRGAELTHHMLAFARRQALQPRPVNVDQLLAKMQNLMRRALRADIELEIAQCGAECEALVDAAQLESALLNLAVNARDAMSGGGKLTIAVENAELDSDYAEQNADVTPGQYILITVSDTGCGISPENLGRVFDPFFTTKEVGKGTGLGLSMVYGFAKQSKGHIKIYSELGHGTSIKLYLPKTNPTSETADQSKTSIVDLHGTEVILLVEDDKALREFARSQLVNLGYRVLEAANGREALGIIGQRADIDLLLTDVVMPGGLNGRDLGLEACKLNPKLKVLYCSGYAESAVLNEGLLDKEVQFLSKPYTRRELAKRIRFMLSEGTFPQEEEGSNAKQTHSDSGR